MTTPRKPGRPNGTATGQATAREAYYQQMAEKARIANAKARGDLVDAATVRRDAFTIARTVRDSMLNIPARVAAELAAESDRAAVERRLEEEIRNALMVLVGELEEERRQAALADELVDA
jgi:phage terminase Nu1 subunit (DNA packaging protein)